MFGLLLVSLWFVFGLRLVTLWFAFGLRLVLSRLLKRRCQWKEKRPILTDVSLFSTLKIAMSKNLWLRLKVDGIEMPGVSVLVPVSFSAEFSQPVLNRNV